ncbi:hypothetical protein OC834_002516, partial [Tilletia horrida]
TSSRTPSFSIPRSGSAGAAGVDSEMRDEVRAERALDPDGQDEIEEEEEDEETKAKHEAFAAKRNQHYGNEAQAMRIAAALAAQEDDDDEDEEEGGGGDGGNAGGAVVPPPVPPLPRINGHSEIDCIAAPTASSSAVSDWVFTPDPKNTHDPVSQNYKRSRCLQH